MLRVLRLPALALGVIALAALAAACGGGADAPEPTNTATVEPTATTEPTSTPEPPLGLDTFHYTVALDIAVDDPASEDQTSITGDVEGDFAAPWSHSWTETFNVGVLGGTESYVIIGEDAWKREGDGPWVATTASDPDVVDATDLTTADPTFLSDLDFTDALGSVEGEPDSVNGVDATRYDLSESIDAFVELFGTDFFQGDAQGFQDLDMVVWLQQDTQTLVRADLTAVAGPEVFQGAPFEISPDADITIHMLIDISQLNDGSIAIEPPV